MYNSYFGFSLSPFENKLDQRFLFLGQDHQEVLSALLYFVQEKKGLGMVCGDVGTGKTMLLQSFLGQLPASVQPIIIANPLVDYQELLVYIANTLGVTRRHETLLGLLDQVKEALQTACAQGKTFILIVDEAHLLSDASLEHIRLLSNIETPECRLLQILLVGQYELSHRLNRPELRQLRQRININRFLSPLGAIETAQYVEHRLQIAGSRFDLCFSPECRTLIHKLTGGVPRRINHLCDTALLICMGEGQKRVSRKTLKKAQEALRTDQIFTARYSAAWRSLGLGKTGKFLLPALAGMFLLALGGLLASTGFREEIVQAFHKTRPLAKAPLASGSPGASSPDGSLAAVSPAAVEDGLPQAEPAPVPARPAVAAPIPANPELLPFSPTGKEKVPPALTTPDPPAEDTSGGAKASASPPEDQRPQPPPNQDREPPAAAPSQSQTSRPRHVVVEENDTLTKIAVRWFPEQTELGMAALLLANPQNLNQDMIFTGQKLNLPALEASSQTIHLKEGICYALYGQYTSTQALQQVISLLTRQGVRYTIMNTRTKKDGISCRVVIGAYENREDLEQALLRVRKDSE